MFSAGTRTFLNVTEPLAMPRSPMNVERRTRSTPGHAVSTTKHEICGIFLPFGSTLSGVRASTAISVVFGSVTFVHHCLSPFRMNALPSSVGVATVLMRAGSEPTSGSVSANAEISPCASRGRYLRFCSSVPNSRSGCGTPMLWCADRYVTVLEQ